MSAMPLMVAILCLMAIAYRYYSAFLAARVAALDDARLTPAMRIHDGQNFHPTNKWVLFGHHFAAISGAGPLIGPVLAAQFGYMPGLLWIVIGVCLAGAVQDFLVLAASIRRGGKSLAQIARDEAGPVAGVAATTAILFILIIALAGLGKVVVRALGGESVQYPAGSALILPEGTSAQEGGYVRGDYQIPAGARLVWPGGEMTLPEQFVLHTNQPLSAHTIGQRITLPDDARRSQPGSTWGVFTIASTIPIALFVGFYMYKIRPKRVLEASLIGAALTLAATFAGGWVSHSAIAHFFNWSDTTVIIAIAIYGFVAAVLPVWVLLTPRDYLSSFLKIGTIALLILGVIIANPKLEAPAFNHVFASGGPTVARSLFPFLFITIMCGAISGFHSLVSSGTTPKMIMKESQARMIGYGAMQMEGLVAVVAMIAAAALPIRDYYAMNTDLAQVPKYHERIMLIAGDGIEHVHDYEVLTQESLRGRTGGAVTLAVGMAHIFDGAAGRVWVGGGKSLQAMWKYWYHFAVMFEALFILTTIDAGTRIGRFLLQEVAGRIRPSFGRTDWLPGALLSTLVIVLAWAYFINANSMEAIWPMFGIANQMLAVIALAVVSVCIANDGKIRYLWVSAVPMLAVATTTGTASAQMLLGLIDGLRTQWHNAPAVRNQKAIFNSSVQAALIIIILLCSAIIVICAARAIWKRISMQPLGKVPRASAPRRRAGIEASR
jgi:carbon starvation protein